jgi:hypothetical protein
MTGRRIPVMRVARFRIAPEYGPMRLCNRDAVNGEFSISADDSKRKPVYYD